MKRNDVRRPLGLAAARGREAGAGLGAGTGPVPRAWTAGRDGGPDDDRAEAVRPEGGLDAATR